MDKTTLRWFIVVLALFGYWYTACETGRISRTSISQAEALTSAFAIGDAERVQIEAIALSATLREINSAITNTFSGLHAAISAVLAALLALETLNSTRIKTVPFWRQSVFSDSPMLQIGILLLFFSWVIVSGWMCFQAFTAPDDLFNVLTKVERFPEAQRSVAAKLKGIWDSVLAATIGTSIGALYAAFSVRKRE